ncbi:TraB/GumN family protein [Muriicola sp. Z0-33]|uniref:TraB/GumN family protein n=1 Tax=Muriicola sp. Z0-33 TaxID=2816957 RepID=UPI0022379868|nr:TraB/GumN family protein [Muriicola sp. Z0-33]MCW5516365.1 TraB/GumN family protein [Muriicola sp. Z0-33]
MRLTIAIIILCFCSPIFAQEKNSLLWEISGNGLEKTSYLYGTMHVSKKIAFRLDDVFYEALDKSEKVALESDPATWLENDSNMTSSGYSQNNGFIPKGFYFRNFTISPPTKEQLAGYLAFEDRLVNNILYRTNEYSQNFEEETYLDMFIYQAGSKFNKPVIALENLEESTALVGRASLNAVKQKPDEWLQKKMQRQDLMFLMQDAYRERNINLLDSIDRAMYTRHYLKNMLYLRNENMAHSLDSVMQTAKVFAGIGAAHLPGEQGVISLLRQKGYTVKPLVSASTKKGYRLKTKFETKTRENVYETYGPDDNFFTVSLPAKLYPVSEYINTIYLSADLANGSYFMVNRVPTYSFLKQSSDYSISDIDELLFENIPGTIIEKTKIIKNGFEGIDIRNKLKNGDYQRYQIYITPLEILIFKMGGEGDYVLVESDTIFNSLKFKEVSEKSVRLTSGYKDFEIKMPALYSFSNQFRKGKRHIESYDPKEDNYYFLRKVTLNDFNFIEEDSFELKQIQRRFYQDLKLDPKYDQYTGSDLTSSATFDSINGKKLFLKTTLKRGDYYLLGTLTKSGKAAKDYFDSFNILDSSYPERFKTVKDTALFFSTVSPVTPPKFVENSNSYYQTGKKPKSYAPYSKKTIYQNKNNEAITVELTKGHDFLTFSNIDSVWALRKKQYSDKKFKVIEASKSKSDEGHYEIQLTLSDTASTRHIRVKNILKGNFLYELKAKVDTVSGPSKFVSEFFENFKPEGTPQGEHILKDKSAEFFKALRANDSIVLTGYRFIQFDTSHIDSLKYYIENFDFPSDKKHIQAHLIQKMGKIDDPKVVSFFKDYYGKSYNNSGAQTKILQAIAKSRDENSVKLLLQLISQDLPLVSNTFEIQNIFRPISDSLNLVKKLYPEILDYSSITEYKSPILSILAELRSEGMIKPSSYKKYRKQLLNDAKIQLKRHLGRSLNKNGQPRYSRVARQQNSLLEDYVILLYPFIKEKGMSQFFERLQLVKDPRIISTYATLLADSGSPMPDKMLASLAADINSRAMLFNGLERIDKLHLFPKAHLSQSALAAAALFGQRRYNPMKDDLHYLDEKNISFRGKTYNCYYFKLGDKQNYNGNFKMHIVVFEDDDKLLTLPYFKNEGMRIEDTESDEEVMEFVTEEFILKDRSRAMVYKPDQFMMY